MSRTDLFDRRVEDLRTEARRLIDWCFKNAKFYKKHGAGLEADIRAFEDCAATLDAFSAGLAVVPPHRAMHMELVRWVRPTADLPNGDEIVMVVVNGTVTRGVHEATGWFEADGSWYEADGMRFSHPVEFWAYFPSGPQPVPALEEAAA